MSELVETDVPYQTIWCTTSFSNSIGVREQLINFLGSVERAIEDDAACIFHDTIVGSFVHSLS